MDLQGNFKMELRKCSHEHPLIFISEGTKGNTSDDEEISRVCRGCALPIFSGSPLYTCEVCDQFSLHKSCAELPMELGHHHDYHELSRTFDREWPFWGCHSCSNLAEHKFFYQCNFCRVILDIICASSDHSPEINTIKHRSHPRHPLELLGRPALLLCDACGHKHEGHFYMCNSCRFYIHQDCASFPRSIKRSEYHAHSLALSYTNRTGYDEDVCVICRKSRKARFWMYWCSRCRCAMHLKCAMSKMEPFMSILLPRVCRRKSDRDDVIRLPPADEFVSVVGHLTNSTYYGNIVDSKEVPALIEVTQLMGCEHTLDSLDNESSSSSIIESFLFGPDRNYFSNVPQCDVCFRAVSPPFYCCKICNLFFHQKCSKLPSEIQHPLHSEHPLLLRQRHPHLFFGIFRCYICWQESNGICYVCPTCDNISLDVKCALLPRNIRHEAHPYDVLTLDDKELPIGSNNCCLFCIRGYSCVTCDFGMHARCALYPSTARDTYDEHKLKIIYDPSQANSDEYYCQICEFQIDQRKWFYHCVECDLSFHIWCDPPNDHQSFRITAIPSIGYHQNLKFGVTGNFKIHPHTLTFVQHLEGSSCNSCADPIYTFHALAFECSECNYLIHPHCCESYERKHKNDVIDVHLELDDLH